MEFSEEVERKYQLITQELEEILGSPETIKKIIKVRPYRIYWGTAPTGEIHIGYLKPMIKLIDFLMADCDVQILIADIHAFLDNMKSTPEQLLSRVEYYQKVIKNIIIGLGGDVSRISFIVGSKFQYNPDYRRDEDRATAITSVKECQKAGAEVVKKSDNPILASLRYPILQALDEEYLGVDSQFGGSDQRKIFTLAQDLLPKLGYKKRSHLMNPMIKALSKISNEENTSGGKMSASTDGDSVNIKIDILDTPNVVRKKIATAFCEPYNVTDNTPMDLLEHIIFPLLQRKGGLFVVNRSEKYGGVKTYENITQVKEDFAYKPTDMDNPEEIQKNLHPTDLKNGIAHSLSSFLTPIQNLLFADPDFIKIFPKAYGRKLQIPTSHKITTD
jgi:tyrosyl-tRNA synthetase